jgi:hypothetical protein
MTSATAAPDPAPATTRGRLEKEHVRRDLRRRVLTARRRSGAPRIATARPLALFALVLDEVNLLLGERQPQQCGLSAGAAA